MSDQELEQVIAKAAKKAAEEAVAAVKLEEFGRCALCVEPDFAVRHAQHHQVIDELLQFMRRMNEAKWTSIKAICSALGLGLVFAFLWFFFGIKQP